MQQDQKLIHIFIVGSESEGAIETYYVAHLREIGFRITIFNPALWYSAESILGKIKFRYFPKFLFSEANKSLLREIETSSPDIVWIFKGVEIYPETLKEIRRKNKILINYNPDHPFIRTIVGNGGKNIQDCIPYYDLHFCYSRDLMRQLQSEYKLKAEWLPFGFEFSEKELWQIHPEDEIHKVCFIGNPDALRAKLVKRIAAEGIPIDIFGYNWNKYIGTGTPNLKSFDLIIGSEYRQTLNKYRVQLNIFRPHNYNSHNMRTFEIPACGGIQLAPASEEHSYFFKEGDEIFLYQNNDELIDKIKSILNMTLETANQVRKAARKRVLDDNHTYAHRAKMASAAILRIS